MASTCAFFSCDRSSRARFNVSYVLNVSTTKITETMSQAGETEFMSTPMVVPANVLGSSSMTSGKSIMGRCLASGWCWRIWSKKGIWWCWWCKSEAYGVCGIWCVCERARERV